MVRTFSKLACDGEGTLRFQGCFVLNYSFPISFQCMSIFLVAVGKEKKSFSLVFFCSFFVFVFLFYKYKSYSCVVFLRKQKICFFLHIVQ